MIADRRAREARSLERIAHVLCDVRDRGRLEGAITRTRPDVLFHLAAYKHVDWAEMYPEEFADVNLHGSWNVLDSSGAAGVETVVVASTDKATLAASFYARTKRLMEQLTAFAAVRDAGAERAAVRLVNVLGSAGSASELFLRQARAGVPLTITDPGMLRFWITLPHAALLVAHAVLLAAEGDVLATAADPAILSVGELASRIWAGAGRDGVPAVDVLGVRPGETMTEVLTGERERLGVERHQGIVPIAGERSTTAAAWAVQRLGGQAGREEARAVWLEAARRPDLIESPSDRP